MIMIGIRLGISAAPMPDGWNFMGGVLPPGVTFSRAGSATYFNASGALVTAAADVPRFDHDPVTLAPRGLLVEASATNALLHSEDFLQSAWVASGATDTNVAGPFGRGAGRVTENSATSIHQVSQTLAAEAGMMTCYLRCPTLDRNVSVSLNLNNADTRVTLNLSNSPGTVISSGASVSNLSVVAMPGGWWRLRYQAANTAAASKALLVRLLSGAAQTYAGNGASHIEIALPQFEAGATVASSYVPTTTAAVTRVADQPRITTVLGVRDVTLTTESGVQVLPGQVLNGTWWPSLTLPARVQKIEVV